MTRARKYTVKSRHRAATIGFLEFWRVFSSNKLMQDGFVATMYWRIMKEQHNAY
jgi:hypothetical protein